MTHVVKLQRAVNAWKGIRKTKDKNAVYCVSLDTAAESVQQKMKEHC